MLLDDDGDGLGCEITDTVQAVQAAPPVVPAPTVEPANQCDGLLGMLGCLLGR